MVHGQSWFKKYFSEIVAPRRPSSQVETGIPLKLPVPLVLRDFLYEIPFLLCFSPVLWGDAFRGDLLFLCLAWYQTSLPAVSSQAPLVWCVDAQFRHLRSTLQLAHIHSCVWKTMITWMVLHRL